jgi:hypothetical protein
MTTHDQRIDTTSSTGEAVPPTGADTTAAPTESSPVGTHPSAGQAEPLGTRTETSTGPTDSSPMPTEPSTAGTDSPIGGAQISAEETLFGDDDLPGLRVRWDEVQSAFVDDPRECVQMADALVSDFVERLTIGFAEARSRLEAQWARGEQASTEDLRLALKRYREFFERLLAV